MDNTFAKALPFFIKSNKLNPSDINTLTALREIFARQEKYDLVELCKQKLENSDNKPLPLDDMPLQFKDLPKTNSNQSNDQQSPKNYDENNVIYMTKREGGTYEIPCKVNGLDLKFILDTGASDVSISLTEALFMLKNGYLEKSDITGTQNYSNANGEIAEGTTITIKKLEFGGFTLSNVEASIVNNLRAPLLLGQSAISRLGKIEIDPKNGTLTIIK